MDRIDMTLRVDRIDPRCLLTAGEDETSATVRRRVAAARERARAREGDQAATSGAALLRACALDATSRSAVERAARTHRLSGRGVTRLLRVARTIADLDDSEAVTTRHILEASCYRAIS
jgi:magnesium chelatase family protein